MTKQEFIAFAADTNYEDFRITNQSGRYYITSATGLTFGDGFGGASFAESDAPADLIAEYDRRNDLIVDTVADWLR